jgi:hypothetical protein
VLAGAAVAAVVLLAGIPLGWYGPGKGAPSSPSGPRLPSFTLTNATVRIEPTFAEGAPQAFGWNGSAALVTGVVGDPGANSTPLALLATLGGVSGSGASANLSVQVSTLFAGGDTLGIGWNGTGWIISGEAAWGNLSTGAVVALSHGSWTNLTGLIEPYFFGEGGVWFDVWNGSAWLLGGESSAGAALVSLRGNSVTDLTGLIPNNAPGKWIQSIGWNGSSWLVGGHGVLGAIEGNRYLDLFPGSVFGGGGAFASAWNGSAWLIGGGSPGKLEYLRGTTLSLGPALPAKFSWWVSTIAWDGQGWYIGGKGSSPPLPYDSELFYLDARSGALFDLSSALPSSFVGGQVEFGAPAPFLGPNAVLLLGQGGLLPESGGEAGPSHGAAVIAMRN